PLGFLFFFFNDTATTEIYTLSLHDALPICDRGLPLPVAGPGLALLQEISERSEEHTSELQSLTNLVCRLLLEKRSCRSVWASCSQSSLVLDGESILGRNFMRRVLALALALGAVSCSSRVPTGTPKPKKDGGTSAPTAFQASGTLSGALTGTVTGVAGYAEANVSGEDPFGVTLQGALGQAVTITSPDPST